MKKKLVTLGLIMGLLLVGCGSPFPDLPDNAEGFKAGSIEDKNGDGYVTIEYEGNTYVPFGTLKGTISNKDVDECIGYIIMDEEISSIPDSENKDTRLYTLKDDPDHIFIMDYYVNGEMEQPMFFRRADSKGEDIQLPKYIDDLDYAFWE